MLTILISWAFVLIYAYRLDLHRSIAFYFNYLILLVVVFSSLTEALLLTGGQLFFRLDEIFFYNEALKGFGEIVKEHDRYLLFVLYNKLALSSAFGFEPVLKLHLSAFGLLVSVVIYDATRSKKALLLFPILFSYILFLSTINMRDILIISATLYFSLKLSRSSSFGRVFWFIFPLVFFNFIRPEAAIFWFLASLWYLIYFYLKLNVVIAYVLPGVLSVFLFVFMFDETVLKLAEFFFGSERVNLYLSNRDNILGNMPFLSNNAAAFIRQLVTPLPHSKLIYFIEGNMGSNLYLYEFSRIIMMLGVYSLVIFSFFRFSFVFRNFESSDFIKIIFSISLFYTMGYSLLSDGGGDSRNKIYPFLFIFVCYFYNYRYFVFKDKMISMKKCKI